MRDVAAIILAAGEGKRLRSATAKVLHPLAGKRVIDYSIDAAKALGIQKIVVVTPPGETALKNHLVTHHPQVEFAIQNRPLGTGHAVGATERAFKGFNGNILILCGDVPLLRSESLKAFYQSYIKKKADLAIMTSIVDNPTGYGRIVRDQAKKFEAIREEKDASPKEKRMGEINCGIYWVKAPLLFKGLRRIAPRNTQHEYYLTDLPAILMQKKSAIATWQIPDARETHGINTRAQLAQAHAILYARTAEHAMIHGVTLEDPCTTTIEPSVVIAQDCTLAPNCHLKGKTRIGKNTHVGTGCVISDCEIGENVHILPYSVLNESKIERGVHIGPFAHLRPGSHLKQGSKVGNFVEMKKTVLGEGSKANHLSYIGDATVGNDVNIGAGTITCNYDGYKKSQTEIGNGAFVGSNSSLIAPVTIGEHSVVGAGSAISKDVPDGALGLTRAPQKIIKGWPKAGRGGR